MKWAYAKAVSAIFLVGALIVIGIQIKHALGG